MGRRADRAGSRPGARAAGGGRGRGSGAGRYQLLAAINAVHTYGPSAPDTDWSQVLRLYDRLVRLDPSPVVRLNRAVAVAEVDGPQVALAEVDRVAEALDGYHPLHVTRAELLWRLGRSQEPVSLRPGAGANDQPGGDGIPHRRRDQLAR